MLVYRTGHINARALEGLDEYQPPPTTRPVRGVYPSHGEEPNDDDGDAPASGEPAGNVVSGHTL